MNPYNKFKDWFKTAKKIKSIDPTSFALGTEYNGKPNVRMVLLKHITDEGFIFFTNLNSNKGKHFKKNPHLSMCFYWEPINRQVRINGKGFLISEKKSDQYFSERPRGSQIGAWASRQSSKISGRKYLEDRVKLYEKKFSNIDVPRPSYWRGILIKPKNFEFWMQGKFRLHQREFIFLKNNKWEKKILSP
jgi:pyridoxamine 5'-phosphate oxidase